MGEEYQIALVEKPEDSAWGMIGRGIHAFNVQQASEHQSQRVCFVVSGTDEAVVRGALGELSWDWLHLDLLWISEELRGRGYGRRLLLRIEDEARQRGAKHVYLDTFSFQAPDFYKRHGYEIFGELGDFPAGHRRFFLRKRLQENAQRRVRR